MRKDLLYEFCRFGVSDEVNKPMTCPACRRLGEMVGYQDFDEEDAAVLTRACPECTFTVRLVVNLARNGIEWRFQVHGRPCDPITEEGSG